MKRKTGMLLLAVGLAVSIQAAQVYSVPAGERIYPGYTVVVDGAAAPVSEVRCSAMPFNRRWPGHQRQIEQTELCGMVRFAFSGRATVAVTAARDFKEVKIRPLSRNVAFHRKGRTVTFDLARPGGYSVEFDGYHNNLHVFADAVKEYALPPNVLRFGPGLHDIGIRQLKSGDTVYLDPGAVVFGGFHASNATDIAILGRGIIDMSRIKEKILFPATGDGHEAVKNAKRWHTIHLIGCRNVRIDGVTVRDSLCYNLGLWGCEDVAISGVKIIGQWRFNTDGIDLHNCRRARVTDCFARTYDDTFCFKAHEGYGNCEDCTFERCVAWNDWGKAFEVGVECRADHLRRLAFRDCDCIHSVAWAMDVTNVDYGRVSDVTFENIRIEKDEPTPATQLQLTDDMPFDAKKGLDAPPRLFLGAVNFHHEYSKENGGKWSGGGAIDGVTIRNVSVTTDGRKPLVMFEAIDAKHRPENIVFEDMTINGRPVSDVRSVELEVGKDAVAPKFVLNDARRMDATEMNPGLNDRLTLAARGCPPDCTIVLPAAPAPSQAFAAAELQKYVRAMTGVTLPIATNVAPARGIFLGNGAPALGNDGFRLVATPPHFRIEGNGVHGTLFGVYDFLERYCGCEWLAPNTEVVPQRDKIEVSATLDDVQKPAFPLRDQNWTDHLRNVGFSAKLKLNGFRIEYPEELGGRDHAKDTTTGGAIFDSLCPPSKYFKDHPDWFALVDGKRRATRAQRCLTNTGFLDFLVAQMKERLRKNYPRCKYYSIYPNDFRHNCQCADCKALDDREGSPSASLVHMANYVAERVCKDYPDVRILTFAYMYTLKPPKTMKVHPNVMICYCTDACDFSKPIRESRWKGCREFVENFRKWKALTDKIYIWDYSANFKYLFQPFECTHVMPGNFRYFKEMGVFGVFEEGDHYGVKCVDEALKTWVIGHLLWNPDQPLEPLLDRFFKGYYGAAADVARGYYEALVEQERRRDEEKEPLSMWGTKLDDPYQPIEFFHEWSAKWTAALEKVKDDPIRRENVYWARHNVDLVRIVRSKFGAKYSLATCVADDLKCEGAALKPVAERVLADFARVKGLNKFRDSEMVRERVESLAQFSLSEQDRRNARVVIPVSSLRVDDRPAVKRVDDPLAAGGKAVRLEASAIGEMHHCLAFREETFLKDPGAKIGVRVHARVERTGVATGSVFSVGTCDIVTYRKRDIRNFHVDVAKVAGDGYAWYDVEGAWTPAGNEVLWISNGKRVNEVNPCIKAVFFDQIELYRKDAAK